MTYEKHEVGASANPATPSSDMDFELVAAATEGDVESFEMLVRRYRRTVLAVGQRITGSRDDAEDIAQQTFMKVFINLSTFRGQSSFCTWLTSIAMNEARMWRRRASRCREVQAFNMAPEQDMGPPIDISDPGPDAESSFLQVEREALLFAQMNQLRPTTRRALELCDLKEESTTRTALLLGISVSAVKSRRSRGRAELRRALARHLSCGHQTSRSKNNGSRSTECGTLPASEPGQLDSRRRLETPLPAAA